MAVEISVYRWPKRLTSGLAEFGFALPYQSSKLCTKRSPCNGMARLCPPCADDVAHLERLWFAIAVVDHNVVELNGRIVDANLQEAVASGSLADFNIVVVVLAVNMRLAQIDPACGMRRRRNIKQQGNSKQ